MATIRIKNLLLRTYIGFNPEELVNKQDVIINIEIEAEIPEDAMMTDEPIDILDYKTLTKKIIDLVETGRFKLLEVLTKKILELVMLEKHALSAKVEVDKPHVLRFAESVSVEMCTFKSDKRD
jgi:D-erythro-7,8-dihydroneopterin triphosphate epimerase